MILHVARREWRELARQPALLVSTTAIYGALGAVIVALLCLLEFVHGGPEMVAEFEARMAAAGLGGPGALEGWATQAVDITLFLLFAQLMGVTGVLAGHTILHDRVCGTLPFLLLSPVRRWQLLVGKVLGAVAFPLLVYGVFGGGLCWFMSTLDVTQSARLHLPPSPGWWIAFAIGAPAWTWFVATVCAVASSVTRDPRSAQQIVWLVQFFTVLLCGIMLVGALPGGAAEEAALLPFAGAACFAATMMGEAILSREVTR
ncbi:MAG: ABC transporter permease subunit [Alphaproteobacteria bacterium]|nr:ABC transporter permease subunit [Alphaproteobacteria bacterium]